MPSCAVTTPTTASRETSARCSRCIEPCERYWHKMLRSRSWAGSRLTWDAFNQIKQRTPLLRPKLRLPYRELQALAVL